MSERIKMLKEELYNPNVDELINERNYVKDLCFKFNNSLPSNFKEKDEMLRRIFNKENCQNAVFLQPLWVDYGYNITFGKNFFANHNLIILDAAPVTFGDDVLIGPNCSFYTAIHPKDVVQRNKGLEYAKKITIGNSVWFGGNVIVLPGVTIGSNVIIGAGSVVTKDIPDNSIAFGNPCVRVKENIG